MSKEIYIKVNSEGLVTMRHNFPFHPQWGLKKSQAELMKEGFFVTSIPEPDATETKTATLYYIDGEFSYTYEDVVVQKTEMEVLHDQNRELQNSLADLWELTLLGGM